MARYCHPSSHIAGVFRKKSIVCKLVDMDTSVHHNPSNGCWICFHYSSSYPHSTHKHHTHTETFPTAPLSAGLSTWKEDKTPPSVLHHSSKSWQRLRWSALSPHFLLQNLDSITPLIFKNTQSTSLHTDAHVGYVHSTTHTPNNHTVACKHNHPSYRQTHTDMKTCTYTH